MTSSPALRVAQIELALHLIFDKRGHVEIGLSEIQSDFFVSLVLDACDMRTDLEGILNPHAVNSICKEPFSQFSPVHDPSKEYIPWFGVWSPTRAAAARERRLKPLPRVDLDLDLDLDVDLDVFMLNRVSTTSQPRYFTPHRIVQVRVHVEVQVEVQVRWKR